MEVLFPGLVIEMLIDPAFISEDRLVTTTMNTKKELTNRFEFIITWNIYFTKQRPRLSVRQIIWLLFMVNRMPLGFSSIEKLLTFIMPAIAAS